MQHKAFIFTGLLTSFVLSSGNVVAQVTQSTSETTETIQGLLAGDAGDIANTLAEALAQDGVTIENATAEQLLVAFMNVGVVDSPYTLDNASPDQLQAALKLVVQVKPDVATQASVAVVNTGKVSASEAISTVSSTATTLVTQEASNAVSVTSEFGGLFQTNIKTTSVKTSASSTAAADIIASVVAALAKDILDSGDADAQDQINTLVSTAIDVTSQTTSNTGNTEDDDVSNLLAQDIVDALKDTVGQDVVNNVVEEIKDNGSVTAVITSKSSTTSTASLL